MQEDRNLAMVNMKRVIEAKKAEKLKQNLHLIDFPKGNTKVSFVSNFDEVKQRAKQLRASSQMEEEGEENQIGFDGAENEARDQKELSMPKVRLNKEKLMKEVAKQQSLNKQQYKRLADALGKSETYGKVQSALTMDKNMKGKGKKRKIEDEEGRTYYKWFAQRKR